VIRDQFQHRSAFEAGVAAEDVRIFETYAEAARALEAGMIDAYASVARAHSGHLARHPGMAAELVTVSAAEKPPAFGCFAFALDDDDFRQAIGR